jgi:cell wall-associated NlpC family hydrolase
MMTLDRRRHAYRDDLADASLRGKVTSGQFVEPVVKQVSVPLVPVLKSPANSAMQETQALMGERVLVFQERDGWAWVQLEADRYVGYVSSNTLSHDVRVVTHRVGVTSTLIFPEANLKSRPVQVLSLHSMFAAAGRNSDYIELSTGGFVYKPHVLALPSRFDDFVAVAEQFVGVPYLWGGKSASGFDCSGLAQLALHSCGVRCPRDADMQEAELGVTISIGEVKRGDLVFWKGHVGIMCDSDVLVHANGYHMMVVKEHLREAVNRIAAKYGQVTSVKRLQ